MDIKDFIYVFWKKEQKEFKKNISVLKKHPAKKAVHDLRVAVKKLRAATELYYHVSEKPLPEDPLQETEKFFSILGKQRDVEICLEIIDKIQKETGKKFPELKCYFRTILSVTHNWSKKAINNYKKKELGNLSLKIKDEMPVIEEDKLKNKIINIINTHLAGSTDLYKKPHKLRQQLKEIYYWIKMLPQSLFNRFEYEKDLHHLLEDYGNWQNFIVFEIKLKHFRKDYLSKTFSEYESIKFLENDIKEKKERLLKDAFYKTRKLLKQVAIAEKEKP